MQGRQIGIIADASYGLRDYSKPGLWFTVNIPEGYSAGQVLFGEDADKFISDAQVSDVKNLNGRACWVNIEHSQMKVEKVISKDGL